MPHVTQTMIQQIHGASLEKEQFLYCLSMLQLIATAQFASSERFPILLEWPLPPYDDLSIHKTKEDLGFQLDWQQRILLLWSSVPASKREKIPCPAPPYTTQKMSHFVQLRKLTPTSLIEKSPMSFALPTALEQQAKRIAWLQDDSGDLNASFQKIIDQLFCDILPPLHNLLNSYKNKNFFAENRRLLLQTTAGAFSLYIQQALQTTDQALLRQTFQLLHALCSNPKELLQILNVKSLSTPYEIQQWMHKGKYNAATEIWLLGKLAQLKVTWALEHKEIHLTAKKLTFIPENISSLSKLRSLQLRNNELTTLPKTMTHLQALTWLDLDNNQLTVLPAVVTELMGLTRLQANNNQLHTIPATIGHLSALTTLGLSHNQLNELPSNIQQLTALNVLQLDGNQLTALPDALSNLKQLKTLSINNNQLTRLPEALAQLVHLQALHLSYNHLNTLPSFLAGLTKLQKTDISHNYLTTIPRVLTGLEELRYLSLSSNELPAIPVHIAQLSNLQTLLLASNRLTCLPDSIGQLKQLKTLDLSYNRISQIPPTLAQLQALKELYVDDNQIQDIPSALENIKTIKTISFDDNPLAEASLACIQRIKQGMLSEQQVYKAPKTTITFTGITPSFAAAIAALIALWIYLLAQLL